LVDYVIISDKVMDNLHDQWTGWKRKEDPELASHDIASRATGSI